MLFDEAGNPAEKAVEPRPERSNGPRPFGNRGGGRDHRGSSRFNAPRRRY